jgi:glycine dehydrogenase subunit 1
LGDKGFRHLAKLNHQKACELADRLSVISGVELLTSNFFNEFTLRLSKNANEVVENLAAKGILGGIPASRLYGAGTMENLLLVTATETNTEQDMDQLAQALAEELS